MSETREDTEKRVDREYAAYVDTCKSDGVEAINFMNWLVSAKFKAKIARGERAIERRERDMDDDALDRARITERRGERKKARERKVKDARI